MVPGIALFLSSLLTICLPWCLGHDVSRASSKRRHVCFAMGLITGAVSYISIIFCWIQPFALAPDEHGGYSNSGEGWLFRSAFISALLTFFLAFFGSGKRRLLLLAGSVMLLVLWYGALISTGP